MTLTDEELLALGPEERRDLMMRVTQLPDARNQTHAEIGNVRRNRLGLLVLGTIGLIPWTAYLGVTLPDRYVAHNWTLTWTGFDAFLALMFAITAVLAYYRKQLVVLAAFTSGILLLCDAWFDLTTAHGDDQVIAMAFAFAIEIPVGLLLIRAALQLLRFTFHALHMDGVRIWNVPLLVTIPPRRKGALPQN